MLRNGVGGGRTVPSFQFPGIYRLGLGHDAITTATLIAQRMAFVLEVRVLAANYNFLLDALNLQT